MSEILYSDYQEFNKYLNELSPSKVFILTDENTHKNCLPSLLKNLQSSDSYEVIKIQAGEENKNLASAKYIWEKLAKLEADRKSLLVNLGGGMVTDLGGFAASAYMRGIKFVNMPTTLLAMVDASIGGKTGIDLDFVKNIVGTFAASEKIFIFSKFLKTLKYKELRSGFAEMLKHGLIADKPHWKTLISLKKLNYKNIFPYIPDSIKIKENIVNQDFNEKGLRKILNFGHTVGHAVESLLLTANKPVPHGEAVAMGMIVETHLSHIEGLTSEKDLKEITENINKFFPKLNLKKIKNKDIVSIMSLDKKNEDGKISFALIKGIGKCGYNYFPSVENIAKALDFYREM